MFLTVNKKTGFKSNSPVVVIYCNGLPFYAKSRSLNKSLEFNLPAGFYEIISGKITTLPQPLEYKLIDLPKPNNETKFNGKVKISYRENPNKCSVDLYSNPIRIIFDNAFKKSSRYTKSWVIGHELGHLKYKGQGQKSEQNCDHYSANLMLKLGYNPSQIDAAIKEAISNGYNAVVRKELLYQNLISSNYKK